MQPLQQDELKPVRPFDVDRIAARAHDTWRAQKRQVGITSVLLEGGEELMVSYDQLSEDVRDQRRDVVRAVYRVLRKLNRR